MMAEYTKTPERQLVEAIARCWLSLKQAAQRHFTAKGFDLTMEQIMVLGLVQNQEGLNPGRIAQEIDRDRTTITRMLDGLERRNLVVRVPDRTDSRQKLVYLTKLARQRLAEMETFATDFLEGIMGNESVQDITGSIGLLTRVTDRAKSR